MRKKNVRPLDTMTRRGNVFPTGTLVLCFEDISCAFGIMLREGKALALVAKQAPFIRHLYEGIYFNEVACISHHLPSIMGVFVRVV